MQASSTVPAQAGGSKHLHPAQCHQETVSVPVSLGVMAKASGLEDWERALRASGTFSCDRWEPQSYVDSCPRGSSWDGRVLRWGCTVPCPEAGCVRASEINGNSGTRVTRVKDDEKGGGVNGKLILRSGSRASPACWLLLDVLPVAQSWRLLRCREVTFKERQCSLVPCRVNRGGRTEIWVSPSNFTASWVGTAHIFEDTAAS